MHPEKADAATPAAESVRLSVVIPCYNGAATLRAQLDALVGQTCTPWEVIVADNGSKDASRAVAQEYMDRLPRLQIIDAGQRRGASFARNAGAAVASGEFVAFCDADDEVDAGWVAGLLHALARNDFVASRFEMQTPHAQNSGLQDGYGFLPHAGGCGLAIRLSLHRKIGGFDVSVRYLEDTDYCWRLQLSGTPLAFAGNALVRVSHGTSASQSFARAWRWAAREVQLYTRYRRFGFPQPDNRAAIREWRRVTRRLLQVIRGRREMSNSLAWSLGTRLGRFLGCVIYVIPMF
jgi:glycosyltransferase involved in cell wall biosynthesis